MIKNNKSAVEISYQEHSKIINHIYYKYCYWGFEELLRKLLSRYCYVSIHHKISKLKKPYWLWNLLWDFVNGYSLYESIKYNLFFKLENIHYKHFKNDN